MTDCLKLLKLFFYASQLSLVTIMLQRKNVLLNPLECGRTQLRTKEHLETIPCSVHWPNLQAMQWFAQIEKRTLSLFMRTNAPPPSHGLPPARYACRTNFRSDERGAYIFYNWERSVGAALPVVAAAPGQRIEKPR